MALFSAKDRDPRQVGAFALGVTGLAIGGIFGIVTTIFSALSAFDLEPGDIGPGGEYFETGFASSYWMIFFLFIVTIISLLTVRRQARKPLPDGAEETEEKQNEGPYPEEDEAEK